MCCMAKMKKGAKRAAKRGKKKKIKKENIYIKPFKRIIIIYSRK